MKSYICIKQSAKNDVIDRDEQEFDDVSNTSHDSESQCTWCSDFFEFYILRNEIPATSGF